MNRPVLTIELCLLGLLLVLLGVATYKFFRMLDRLGIDWERGLPVAAVFGGAAFLTARRVARSLRSLRRGEGDGIREPDDH